MFIPNTSYDRELNHQIEIICREIGKLSKTFIDAKSSIDCFENNIGPENERSKEKVETYNVILLNAQNNPFS